MNSIGNRAAAILVASALGFGLAGCGGDDDDDVISTGGTTSGGGTSSGGGSAGAATGGTQSGGAGGGAATGGSAAMGGSAGEGTGGGSAGNAGEAGGGAFATVVDCASSTPALTVDVTLPNFDPDDPSVDAGDVVEFENTDAVPHTATSTAGGPNPSPDGRWDTGTIDAGESVCVRFEQAGDSEFYCQFHPAMTGTLTVN